jgi:hypothetical protein
MAIQRPADARPVAAESEIYDHTAAGAFRCLKGERSDGTLEFLDQKAAD